MIAFGRNEIPKQQYLRTWCQSVVPNDAPRDFGPEVGFGAKFQIPVARQEGKQMMAPRPYVTEPFRPLSWINNWSQFVYTPISKNVVAENGQWQLSNGNCTNERNCGFHIWYAKKLVLCVAQNRYRLTNGQLAPA